MTVEMDWAQYCKDNITAGYTPGSKKENVYLTRFWLLHRLTKLGIDMMNKTILDYGCGNGRLAFALRDTNISKSFKFRYIGMDVIEPCIEFCRKVFSHQQGFGFQWIDVYNSHYWGRGSTHINDYKFPSDFENDIDIVVMNSVFTHIYPMASCAHLMREVKKILKPGGDFIATWLKSPPMELSREEARTVYPRNVILKAYKNIGYEIIQEHGGNTTNRLDQWIIHARYKNGS